ncbi:MAG: outer membrane protein assembly factor BamE [Xanthomonadales bacterium]|nr:outer membrane protein assembly factor BamE [Xanthomonadales bacterium]
MPSILRSALLASSLSALVACGAIYKVDVYQGNLLESANVEQVKVGMSKRQVLTLLGSPSVADPFHQDRWDYLTSQSQRGSDAEVKNLVLTFDGDQLASIEGDYFPEQDEALVRRLAKQRYVNLPREEKNKRRAGR